MLSRERGEVARAGAGRDERRQRLARQRERGEDCPRRERPLRAAEKRADGPVGRPADDPSDAGAAQDHCADERRERERAREQEDGSNRASGGPEGSGEPVPHRMGEGARGDHAGRRRGERDDLPERAG